jgi:gliding motility-associated-like protein
MFLCKYCFAQVVTIGTSTTNSYFYGPYYRSSSASTLNYSRYCYLYSSSELGIPSGATITKIEWQKASGTISAPNTFKIFLKNSTLTSLTTGSPWSSLSTGATTVYNSANQPFTLTSGWEAFNLTTSFNYTGGSLMILTDHIKSGTASAANNYYYTLATGKSIGFASNIALTSTTTLSSATYGNNRPNIRITYSTCASQPTNQSNAIICQPGIATISATPSSGANTVRWYTSLSGGTLLFTGTTYSANYSASTIRYAASYNTINGCESPSRIPVSVNISPLSAPISISEATICQSGTATISATPASGANTIRWYTTSSGGTLLFTGNNYSANYTSATTRYAASYNTINGCESPSRIPVTVTISQLSAPISISEATICLAGTATISASPASGANTIRWYTASSGGTLLFTGNNYSAYYSNTTTRYAASYNSVNGCQSSSRIAVTVNIDMLSSPNTITGANICQMGITALSAVPASGANTIKWYTASSGGTLLFTGTYYSANYSNTTTRYAASYNTINNCESINRTPVVVYVYSKPIITYSATTSTFNQNTAVTIEVNNGSPPYLFDWSFDGIGDFDDNQNQNNLPSGIYTLTVKDSKSCKSSSEINIEGDNIINISTGISPNNDGKNDTWQILGVDNFDDLEIRVFDINGILVYSQNNKYIPWDAKFNNQLVPTGEYYFFIESVKKKKKYTGVISVRY